MDKILDTVLLFSLPASGKSEVRTYLNTLTPEQCIKDFHIGPTLQLDDYPYVHLMHRIDDELKKNGWHYCFYFGPQRPFQDPFEWLTLVELLNEDYRDLRAGKTVNPYSAGHYIMDRFDEARKKVGLPPSLQEVPYGIRCKVANAIEEECRREVEAKNRICSSDLTGKTIFIEAARGGPNGSAFPITPPRGYLSAFNQLSLEILSRACILYVWVTPEESRRKNIERGRPDGQGSILHHSVPLEVMLGEYGCDDMEWLRNQSDKESTIKIERIVETIDQDGKKRYATKVFYLPVAFFDNRIDKTSFVREPKDTWKKEDIQALHQGLKQAFDTLARVSGIL